MSEIEQQPVSFWKKRSTWIGIGVLLLGGAIERMTDSPDPVTDTAVESPVKLTEDNANAVLILLHWKPQRLS